MEEVLKCPSLLSPSSTDLCNEERLNSSLIKVMPYHPHQAFLSFTISWSLLKLMFIELMMPSIYLIFCHPLLLLPSIFPSIRVFFQWVSSLHQVDKVLELQGWFLLGLTGLISLQSKGLSTPQFKIINSLVFSFVCGTTLMSIHNYRKNHSFDYTDLCQQSNVSAF